MSRRLKSYMARRPRLPRWRRGQSLVEFAIILPLLLALVGGVVQLGAIITTKHALVQVTRDTARWASTHTPTTSCSELNSATPRQPLTQAGIFATESRLLGYSANPWTQQTVYADNAALPLTPPLESGVEVVWSREGGGACKRPTDNKDVQYVTVRLSYGVPVFIPALQLVPDMLTCSGSGCTFPVSVTAVFRMEPQDDQ